MSKSILVIDAPETCLDCRFCRELHEGIEACCELSDEPNDKELCRMIEADYCQEKPDWCPLRDFPEKKPKVKYQGNGCFGINEAMKNSFNMGFDSCIDEILKGENENE